MNFLKKLYTKLKTSYDEFWTEYEKQMSKLSPEERMLIMNNFKGEQL